MSSPIATVTPSLDLSGKAVYYQAYTRSSHFISSIALAFFFYTSTLSNVFLVTCGFFIGHFIIKHKTLLLYAEARLGLLFIFLTHSLF